MNRMLVKESSGVSASEDSGSAASASAAMICVCHVSNRSDGRSGWRRRALYMLAGQTQALPIIPSAMPALNNLSIRSR